ncbi:MAG: hypothetical protein WD356_02705 [Pseudomonadales bacterium]
MKFAGYVFDSFRKAGEWIIAQGEDMQRPSRIHVGIHAQNGQLQQVRIGGSAVRICQGTLQCP